MRAHVAYSSLVSCGFFCVCVFVAFLCVLSLAIFPFGKRLITAIILPFSLSARDTNVNQPRPTTQINLATCQGFLQQSRPSRSRQREPVPGPERARTPCINRDTVLRINRRPVRHRSCDSFWPPQQQHGTARSPSPRGTSTNLGGAEGGSFAYDIGAYGHYGSHESVYFDERVRKQHKIEPLRTMFDKANVVLVDWGGRNKTAVASTTPPPAPTKRLSDNGLYDRRCQEKVVGDDDAGNNSVKQGEMIESEAKPPTPPVPDVAPPRPPSPPPRRYFLPMEQLQSGVGIEILLRCYGAPTSSLNQSESQEISTSKIDDGTDSRQRAKQQQQPRPPPPPGFPAFTEDRTLYQDGIQSKPPLKSRATPTKRFPSKPPTPTPTIFPVNHSDDPSPMTTANQDEFNINSNTILNLNIDNNTLPSTTVPRITVTDCPELRGATSKTNDQLWHEIIDENHNYNEKLITNSSSSGRRPRASEFGVDDLHRPQLPNEQHSKLNVSNQANRNWINLNSNEIYPHSTAPDWQAAPAAARVTKTRVRSDSFEDEPSSTATATNDDPVLTVIRSPVDNYDNKSIKSNYCANDAHGLRRSESRDSARSWRVDEVLEFPPPPPYLCDCDDNSPPSSGRCSAEQGLLSRGDYRLFVRLFVCTSAGMCVCVCMYFWVNHFKQTAAGWMDAGGALIANGHSRNPFPISVSSRFVRCHLMSSCSHLFRVELRFGSHLPRFTIFLWL